MDLHNNIEVRRAISPVIPTNDTALTSEIIDMANFEALEFVIATGALDDSNATFTVLVEEGDAANLSDNAAVDDVHLLGTEVEASFRYDDDNEVRKIGYVGMKRYVRLTITPSGNTSTAPIAAVAILSGARKCPRS